jgi:spermidine synthase
MGLLFSEQKLPSEKNGEIALRTWFGQSGVYVNEYDQSSGYIRRMWRRAFRFVSRSNEPKRILMLGLGTGSALPEFRRRLPNASITAVEWDPVMIELFRSVRPHEHVEIIEGDAQVILANMDRQFDVILVDLFKGKEPAPCLFKAETIANIRRALADDGECIVNAFATDTLFSLFDAQFARTITWSYKFNHLAKFTSAS